MLGLVRCGRAPAARLVHQPVEHAHVGGGLLQRVLQPRPLGDQRLVRDLDRCLAGEQEAAAFLGRELAGQRAARRIEIDELGGPPRRAASLAETDEPGEQRREPFALARVELVRAHALGLVRERAGDAADLRIGDEQTGAIRLVPLPHGVERHLHQREIAGAIADVAPDRGDHGVLLGKVAMAGEARAACAPPRRFPRR